MEEQFNFCLIEKVVDEVSSYTVSNDTMWKP